MTRYLRTAILLAGLTALFGAIGFAIGGKSGMMIALLVAFGMNVFAWWNSADMVLTMYGAQEVDACAAPQFYGLVQQLAQRAGLPMPRVYIIHDAQPNAFATGRNPGHAAVAATTGLLESLSPEELAGVIAHELAHVKNHDTLIMTITATIAGAISMIANVGLFFGGGRDERDNPLGIVGTILMMILAPIAAMVVQMAISRTREYEADRLGADICRQPLWLAGALERIDALVHHIPSPAADAHPATAHLFIINPLHGSSLASLFSTHPSTQERVRRLQRMAGAGAGTGHRAGAGARGPWG